MLSNSPRNSSERDFKLCHSKPLRLKPCHSEPLRPKLCHSEPLRPKLCHSEPLQRSGEEPAFCFVIPNRAERPARNLLFAGAPPLQIAGAIAFTQCRNQILGRARIGWCWVSRRSSGEILTRRTSALSERLFLRAEHEADG